MISLINGERIIIKSKENPWIVYGIDENVDGYAHVSKYNPREQFKFSKYHNACYIKLII